MAPNQASATLPNSPRLPKHLHVNITQLLSCHFSTCQLSPPLDCESQKGRAGAVLVTTVSPTPSSTAPGPEQVF